ncbi:hypothetical protein FTX61_12875 [Nitriliruptoraceae bacterium ZYF776]|nr:hypothetical protein [Profundirhabdus halotolerans]
MGRPGRRGQGLAPRVRPHRPARLTDDAGRSTTATRERFREARACARWRRVVAGRTRPSRSGPVGFARIPEGM